MRSKKIIVSNFSRALSSQASCIRPDNEQQLADYMATHQQQSLLIRGSGLSYNDSCFNTNGTLVDSSRFNHLIRFDTETGIVVCQGGAVFNDLFLVHPDFIPPVIPGTLHATVAGGIAHDVHGKNNHRAGSLGHHLIWFDLVIGTKKIRCSREENSVLFHTTIAGLGLTGAITQVALRLQKNTRFVITKNKQFTSINALIDAMSHVGLEHDYQVAWLDLLNNEPRALLSTANHCDAAVRKKSKFHAIPKLPFSLIHSWDMKLFNKFFFNHYKREEKLALQQFNNPLDKLKHWNRLYGPKGLIQFQAVFAQDQAVETLKHLVGLMRLHKATPTLAVLKLFTQSGAGLLSFCKPGFTLAVDFIYNEQAKHAIMAMNQYIADTHGGIYLAKDMLLNAMQYKQVYANHKQFSQILKQYNCNMHSDLANRLGIVI
ncbi:FAD-binding oxidoreductase [Legionella drancourtii]|uniref:FAD-binding PCMH-type domain-containing protein n=1 Tax=Legionella drancourtii LLAP12 TaxID=658187 RepID=G9EM18_9GAMM|nr:FAD-binding oxidoreductase [Legionella drancourtii]EHL31618.1 hypothetical protein LDG_6279 [Legionella drancourtii LLAP12]